MIERVFAGESRQFALRPSRFSHLGPFGYEGSQHGNLAMLWQQAKSISLPDSAVRHVLAHALAGPDDPAALFRARTIVAEEMDGKPLAVYMALARDVLIEALVGAAEADAE